MPWTGLVLGAADETAIIKLDSGVSSGDGRGEVHFPSRSAWAESPLAMIPFRRSLSVCWILALLASDAIAIRHVGSCCPAHSAGIARGADNSDVAMGTDPQAKTVCCTHSRCLGSSRQRDDESDRSQTAASPAPGSQDSDHEHSHDSNSCSICRWFAGGKCGFVLDLPCLVERQVVTPSVVPVIPHAPRDLSFFSSLSRRGPPLVGDSVSL